MSSWFPRPKKSPGGGGGGDGGGGGSGDSAPANTNERYNSVPDEDDEEALNQRRQQRAQMNLGQQILHDFTIPGEEYDPDFEADLARAISESLSIKNNAQNAEDEASTTPQSRYKNVNKSNNNNHSFSGEETARL